MRSAAVVVGLAVVPGLAILLVDWTPSVTRQPEGAAVPSADVPAIESSDADAPSGPLPARVWWRDDGDAKGAPFVSDRPGGAALPGSWTAWCLCGFDTRPSGLLFSPSPARHGFERSYDSHWLSTVRDGVEWWCFTEGSSRVGAASAEETRRFVGTWKHDDGNAAVRLELLADGTGRGSDGSTWEWTGIEDGLELRLRKNESIWSVTACILDADGRGYRGRHDAGLVGTRVEPPPSGK